MSKRIIVNKNNNKIINRKYTTQNSNLLTKDEKLNFKNNISREITNKLPIQLKIKNSKDITINKQYLVMEKVFKNLHLNTLEEFKSFNMKQILQNGGRSLGKLYNNNLTEILLSLYPNYPWKFSIQNLKIKPRENFKSIENQRNVMHKLFIKFNLNSLGDWKFNRKIFESNVKSLLAKRYKGNFKTLLSTIYPYYPWDFLDKNNNNIKNKENKSIEYQRKYMEKLFKKYKLKSIEEWISFPKKKIGLFSSFKNYKEKIQLLLIKIYPNYPWEFEKFSDGIKSLKLIENQRKLIDKLFIKLNLKSVGDWLHISRESINQSGGNRLLYFIYKGDIQKMLKLIYPNYPWEFEWFKIIPIRYFKLIENQQKFMDDLFIKFNLNSLDDWLNISRLKIVQNGGSCLIRNIYNNDLEKLLISIYPNYDWKFEKIKIFHRDYFYNDIENQKKIFEKIFFKFKLTKFEDWYKISKKKILLNGGRGVLKKYNFNKQLTLCTLYPNYPWCFSIHLLRDKFKELIEKFYITQKKIWYRLPLELNGKFNLPRTLKLFYPHENWKKSNFQIRKKKTIQRLLFSFIQKIYPSLLIFEDYFHPKLIQAKNNYELDIFIPSLQLALEYQGEQHYDDIPGAFAGIDLFQSRDEAKEKLAKELNIKIIYIPYWWDQSLSSLQSSLQSSP